MAVKSAPVYVCDFCENEMASPIVVTEDVANEGCSSIRIGDRSFDVGGQHYCSFSCLINDIGRHLDTPIAKPAKKGGK